MYIAKEKREENAAEYIIYMWQLEDMIRGLNFDMEAVNTYIVSGYTVGDEERATLRAWYENLVEMMKREHLEKSGHLQVVQNILSELEELHYFLLNEEKNGAYGQRFVNASGNLAEYRRRANKGEEVSDVALALEALYGGLMLRLQGREVRPETANALKTFSEMLSYLAADYRRREHELEEVLR